MTVLRARGGELERQFPFGVALQLFEPYLSSASPRERRRVLAGAAAHAAPLLSGDVGGRESGAPEFPLLHGLHWVVANIAERQPLLIAVDDAHSADDASLRALLFIAQRIEDLPLAIVLTARPRPAASAGSGDALERARDAPARAALRAAAAQRAGDRDDRAALAARRRRRLLRRLRARHERQPVLPARAAQRAGRRGAEPTRSAPSACSEVEALGPLTIAQAVDARIRRLSPGAPALAHAVAVLGDDVPLVHAAALAQLDAVDAATAADELAGADVLRPAPELGFVHPIVRQAVYLGIPTAERGQLHLAAAELLRATRAARRRRARRGAPAARRCRSARRGSWRACTPPPDARSPAARPTTAASYLLRALDESPPQAERAELLVDLGRAEALAGLPSAVERLRTAVALLEQPAARARALAQLGQALYAAGDNAGAASAFDEGLRVLDGADPVLEEQLTAGYLGAARLDFRTRETAQTRFRDLLAGSTEAATPAQRELLAQRALEHAMQGNAPADEVVELVRHAHAGGELLREATADGVAWAGSVATLLFCDALDEVEQATSAGLEDARRRGSVIGFAVMSTVRGASRYLRGDLTGALGDLEGGLERVPLMVLVRPFAHGWMALAHIDRGEFEQAHALVGVPDEEQDAHFTYNWSLFARGRLALAQGESRARARGPARVRPPAAGGSRAEPRRAAVALGGGDRRASPAATSSRRARWRTRSWSSRARSARRARSATALRAAGLVADDGERLAAAGGGGRGARALAGAARARARARRPRRRAARGRSAHDGARDAAHRARHRPPRGRRRTRRPRRAPRSSPPARARGARRCAAPTRSRRASGASPSWPSAG